MSFDTDPRESVTLGGAEFAEMCNELSNLNKAVLLMLKVLEDIEARTVGNTLTDVYTRKQIRETTSIVRQVL